MSKYTMELRYLTDYIEAEGTLKAYEIFDDIYRAELNARIINHFYFHEIAFETPARFCWYLKNKMAEIMPYYNQLYKSTKLTLVNPLISTNIQHSSDGGDTIHNEGGNTQSGKELHSDTPQALVTDSNIEDNYYITDATIRNNSDTVDTTTTTTHQITSTDSGFTIPESQLLQMYRESFINIDVMILNELKELFLQIY